MSCSSADKIATVAAEEGNDVGHVLEARGAARMRWLAVAPALYRKLGYDLMRDFTPVALLGSEPLCAVVHPSLPVKSVREFYDNRGAEGSSGTPREMRTFMQSE